MKTSIFFAALLFHTTFAWYANVLGGSTSTIIPVETAVLLTSSYIPAALQVTLHILQELDFYEDSHYRFFTPVIIDHREENETVILELMDFAEEIEEPAVKSIRRKLINLVTILNNEAQKQNLDSYDGMAPNVLSALVVTSKLTARDQLLFILMEVSEHEISSTPRREVDLLINELKDTRSDTSQTLSDLKALPYTMYSMI